MPVFSGCDGFFFSFVANVEYLWGKDLLFNAIKFYLPKQFFACPRRDWGILKRMRAINVFPEAIWKRGTDSSMLEFRAVLLAAERTCLRLSYISQKYLLLTCLEKNLYPIYSHFHDKKCVNFILEG